MELSKLYERYGRLMLQLESTQNQVTEVKKTIIQILNKPAPVKEQPKPVEEKTKPEKKD